MKKLILLLIILLGGLIYGEVLYSFDYRLYDPEKPVTEKFIPTLKDIENPKFEKWIIVQLTQELRKNPKNFDLHRIRLDYIYYLWEVSPSKDEKKIVKYGVNAVNELCKYFPNHPHCYLSRAIMLSLLGLELGPLNTLEEVPRVIKLYQKAAAMNPTWFYCFAVRNLGRLYFKLPGFPASVGDYDKAEKYLKRAYRYCPDHPDIYVYLGDLYYIQGKKKKAIEFVKKLYTLKPRTWLEKIVLQWTLRTVPVIIKKYETGTYDKYNWDYLLDPSRHPEKYKKKRKK